MASRGPPPNPDPTRAVGTHGIADRDARRVLVLAWVMLLVVSLAAVPTMAARASQTTTAQASPHDVGAPTDTAPGPISPTTPDTSADALPAAPLADVPPPEAFGHGSMPTDGGARGVRRVVVVLLEYDDQELRDPHDRAFYADRMANVSDYFTENSRGRFTWGSPTIVGPYTITDDPDTDWDEGRRECWWDEDTNASACDDRPARRTRENTVTKLVAERAMEATDLARYDRNDNGELDQDELAIVAFQAGPPPADGGMVRFTCSIERLDDDGVDVCLNAAVLGEGAGFGTTAHELAHQLGTVDLYGSASRSTRFSLMGATIFGVEDDDDRFHLDPWHKIQLGWTTPVVYDVDALAAEGRCAYLTELAPGGSLSNRDTRRPVILYDPDRYDPATRTGEYYVLEYRNPVSYDRDVPERGVVAWYVRTEGGELVFEDALIHANGPSAFGDDALMSTPDGDDVKRGEEIHAGPNGVLDTSIPAGPDFQPMDAVATDAMNYVIAPGTPARGAPANYTQRGVRDAWTSWDYDFELRWFDGEALPTTMRVLSAIRDGVNLDLNTEHIAIESAPSRVERAETFELGGHLGAGFASASGDRRRIVLAGGGVAEDLPSYTWMCHRLRTRVPEEVPTGTYRLWIEDPVNGAESEARDLNVRTVVDANTWIGRYDGRLDGREAELTIDAHDEFTYAISVHDQERDVTFRGTHPGTDRHVIEDLTLRSDAGDALELDALTLHREDRDRLSGASTWEGARYGLAFAAEGAEPVAAYDDDPLARGADDPWVEQWTDTYRGSLDGHEATLRVTGGEATTFGTLRPGEGYRFAVELEDHETGTTYRGDGLVDTTTAGGEHVLELTRLSPNGTAETDPDRDLRDVRLRLHTWDTGVISGSAAVGRDVPGYGPKAEAVGMHFVAPGPATIEATSVLAVREVGAADYPAFARPLLADERVNLVVGEATIGVDTDGTGEPTAVRRTAHEDPTLIVTLEEDTLARIQRSPDPNAAVRQAVLDGEIDYRATTITGRLGVGVVKRGVAVYNAGRWLRDRVPFV